MKEPVSVIVSIQKAKVVGALSKKFAAGSIIGPKPSVAKPLVMVNMIPTVIPQDVIINVDSEKEKNIYTDFTSASPPPTTSPVPSQDATVVETTVSETKVEETVSEEATAEVPPVSSAVASAAPFSIPSPAPVSVVPESELPAGWTQHVGKSGKTFYYKAETKTTQWYRPIA